MLAPTTPPRRTVWAVPISLAATDGIEVSLFSSGYLDVSVPQVRLHALCIQAWISRQVGKGFPIRTSQDQSLVASSSGHIAGSHVLRRLLTPRHPPHALSSLTTSTSDQSRDGKTTHPDTYPTPVRCPCNLLGRTSRLCPSNPPKRRTSSSVALTLSIHVQTYQPNLSTCQRTSV